MKPPRKAIVLAAGYGTRLEPLTRELPKCLLPFWGRPIIDRTLATLARWGVRDVLVNLHHAPQPLWSHLCRLRVPGLRIACSYEPDILGTGGALARAAWFLGDDPLWMLNADIVFRTDPRILLRAFDRPRTMAALLMTADAGPRTVERRPSGTVRTFRSARPGTPGTVTFCGIQLLAPAIVRFLPADGFATIVAGYERAARAGWRVVGAIDPHAQWMDIGTPEGLLAAHAATAAQAPGKQAAALRRRGASVSGFVSLAPDVRVARGARLHNVIALPGAAFAADAVVRDAVVGPGVRASGRVQRMAVRVGGDTRDPFFAIARALGWPPADTVAQPLSPRGSARTFTRLTCGRRRAIVIRYRLERPENARFAGHARFLHALRLPVPRILIDAPESQLVVTSDVGLDDLQSRWLSATPRAGLQLYVRVIGLVARWHRVGGAAVRRTRLAMEPPFDATLFRWEHQLFRTHYLEGRLGLSPRASAAAVRPLAVAAQRLIREPQTLLHRDLQSTNILFHHGRAAFIDFQGMRLGPAVYDLASLVADPYVMLPEAAQDRLLHVYAMAAGRRDDPAFREAFWTAVVQRLVQAIGAYGRLSRLPGTGHFQHHIQPALEMLDRALTHLYTQQRFGSYVRQWRAIERQRVHT